MHYLVALCLAWGLGIILTYVLNFTWVFKPERQLRFQARFVKYVVTNLISFLLNVALLRSLVTGMHWDPFYVQLGIMPGLIIGNFAATKLWSMKARLGFQ